MTAPRHRRRPRREKRPSIGEHLIVTIDGQPVPQAPAYEIRIARGPTILRATVVEQDGASFIFTRGPNADPDAEPVDVCPFNYPADPKETP